MDLITIAQALYWFDRPHFYHEAKRVLRPGGVLCAWTYATLRVDTTIDEVLDHIYSVLLGPYWPEERRLVDERYQSIGFPFNEIQLPAMRVRQTWNLPQLLGCLSSWSALARYRQDRHRSDVTNRSPVAGSLARGGKSA